MARPGAGRVPSFTIPSPRNLVLLVPRMLGATFSAAVEVFYLTAANLWPNEHGSESAQATMDGRVSWRACIGDRVHHKLKIINGSSSSREFTISAEPFRGTDVVVDIDVAKCTLPPGGTLDAEIALAIPEHMAGGSYAAVVIVHGAYAQRLPIELTVRPRQEAMSIIEQADTRGK